jgi:hypothetical protein
MDYTVFERQGYPCLIGDDPERSSARPGELPYGRPRHAQYPGLLQSHPTPISALIAPPEASDTGIYA